MLDSQTEDRRDETLKTLLMMMIMMKIALDSSVVLSQTVLL